MGVRDVLDGVALVAQLSGLHAVMLVALALHFLRIPQCEAECTKLEECARRLRAMLQWWPAPAGETQLPAMAAGALLLEADGLVGSHRRSPLWRRAWNARSVEPQLRDARDCLDCLRALVLGLHVNLLLTVHQASSETNNATDLLHAAEAYCDSISDSQRYYNGTGGQGGGAHHQSHNTEPAGGFESPV